MTLKAGTVCYLVRPAYARGRRYVGRVVTITGGPVTCEDGIDRYAFDPPAGMAFLAQRRSLVPISDPDQPVDVTSDRDEPVTV